MNISELDYNYENMTWNGPPSFKAQRVMAVVIYVVVFVVGVPGNTLVLWVTVSEARRSVNAIWFLNLAVADLLSCLVLPIQITTVLKHGNWVFGETACRILNKLFYCNLYASVLLLATISTDRFLLVFQPFWCQKYRVSWVAWLACGLTWMLALVLSNPHFVFAVFYVDLITNKDVCVVNFWVVGPEFEAAIIMTLFVLTFLVPLVTMSVCYTLLLLRAWRRPATRSPKTLKMVVAVVTSFFVFWLPYQLAEMLYVFLPSFSFLNWELVESLYIIGMALAYVNCCINPIIYMAAARGLHIRVFKFQPGRLRQLLTED